MQHIRLAIYGLSPFADDIVRALVDGVPNIDVVASMSPSGDLLADFDRAGADVLICAFPESDMERLWSAALAGRPALAVLNMVDDHTRGRFLGLYAHDNIVADLSEESLLHALAEHVRLSSGD